jgi:hypothetical protein
MGITMARGRMIASDIFNDEFFCELTLTERLLWIGIITQCADDQGRLSDKPNYINSTIFPDDLIPVDTINAGLNKFSATKKIFRYSTDSKKMIQIVKWWTYQTPTWAMPSKYPCPAGWTDRVKAHVPGSVKSYTINWDSKGGWKDNINPIQNKVTNPVTNLVSDGINELKRNEINLTETKESEDHAPGISPIQQMIEHEIGIMPSGVNDIQAMDEMEKMHPTKEDIHEAAEWLRGQGKTIRYYSSLTECVRTAIAKRVQPKKKTVQSKNDEILQRFMENANGG